MKVRRKKIAALVDETLKRRHLQKPSIPVREIAESLGIRIIEQFPDDESLSGVLIRDKTAGTAMIGVNCNHHPNRQRFTIAHEIGHFLLHGEEETVHVDRRFVSHWRDGKSSDGTDIHEREANLFAASLLMPEQMIMEDLEGRSIDMEDTKLIRELADKYLVSTQAMAIRLSSLGLFID